MKLVIEKCYKSREASRAGNLDYAPFNILSSALISTLTPTFETF